MRGENNRAAFHLVLFSSHTVSVSDLHLHVVTHKLWSHLLQGWVSDSSTATDRFKLVWSGQSSQSYCTLSAVVLRPASKNKNTHAHHMRAHTHTDTHTRITESVVASIHYYDNVAPFCPKIIFKVDGITWGINNFTHTLYMFICIVTEMVFVPRGLYENYLFVHLDRISLLASHDRTHKYKQKIMDAHALTYLYTHIFTGAYIYVIV